MLFNSPEFIFVFLPIVFLAFVAVGRYVGPVAALVVLIAASLVFYAYWRIDDLLLLCLSISANFVFGLQIHALLDKSPRKAKIVLIAGIVFNLSLIAVFKYLGFLSDATNTFFGTRLPHFDVILPLGISFFTFTQITFLVDVYRRLTIERSPLRYALFVTFFPHLIAGPILHQSSMSPQFQRKDFGCPHLDDIMSGVFLFVIGLFKKVIFADSIATFVSPVFDTAAAGGALTFWEAWAGALAYTMQIYFDFSGYSDMAVGLGLMFGIRLPVNFNSPYQATSIIDFWRRWHMTLSAFLRDYLYVPLGGNRHGKVARYRNLMVTMLLGGLWHGANWTFVLWGGLHGLLICINHLWRRLDIGVFLVFPQTVRNAVARLLTFIAVVVCWVPFRSESLTSACNLWRAMLGWDRIPLPSFLAGLFGVAPSSMFANGLLQRGNIWVFEIVGLTDSTIGCIVALTALYVICAAFPNTQHVVAYDVSISEQTTAGRSRIFNTPVALGALVAICFWLCVFSFARPTQFLYFNF